MTTPPANGRVDAQQYTFLSERGIPGGFLAVRGKRVNELEQHQVARAHSFQPVGYGHQNEPSLVLQAGWHARADVVGPGQAAQGERLSLQNARGTGEAVHGLATDAGIEIINEMQSPKNPVQDDCARVDAMDLVGLPRCHSVQMFTSLICRSLRSHRCTRNGPTTTTFLFFTLYL